MEESSPRSRWGLQRDLALTPAAVLLSCPHGPYPIHLTPVPEGAAELSSGGYSVGTQASDGIGVGLKQFKCKGTVGDFKYPHLASAGARYNGMRDSFEWTEAGQVSAFDAGRVQDSAVKPILRTSLRQNSVS